MIPKWRVGLALVFVVAMTWPGLLTAQVATPVASPVAAAIPARVVARADGPVGRSGEDFFRYATGGWQDRTRSRPTRRPTASPRSCTT